MALWLTENSEKEHNEVCLASVINLLILFLEQINFQVSTKTDTPFQIGSCYLEASSILSMDNNRIMLHAQSSLTTEEVRMEHNPFVLEKVSKYHLHNQQLKSQLTGQFLTHDPKLH